MIGIVDINLTAECPNLPLRPVCAYVGSPQSFRIAGVPKDVGSWRVTGVSVRCIYPDGTSELVDCRRLGGVWVGTVAGCATPGVSKAGFVVVANGTDERGGTVAGYVLGVGDVEVVSRERSVTPGTVTFKGDRGDDGDTPIIGENGNWWIAGVDTGFPARGPAGKDGAVKSVNGKDGAVRLTALDIDLVGDGAPSVDYAIKKALSDADEARTTASSKYTKPDSGIPASHIANGVIPEVVDPSAAAKPGQAAGAKATYEAIEAGVKKVTTLRINDGWRFSVAPGITGALAIRLEHLDFPSQDIWGIKAEMVIPEGLGVLARTVDTPGITKDDIWTFMSGKFYGQPTVLERGDTLIAGTLYTLPPGDPSGESHDLMVYVGHEMVFDSGSQLPDGSPNLWELPSDGVRSLMMLFGEGNKDLVAVAKRYGGTQIKQDENGEFYYEVEV